jgi:FkbM family methyltransferase
MVMASCINNDAAIRFGNRTAIDIIEHFKGNDGPKVLVDVGGNVGTVSIVVGLAVKNIKIFVAEPHPACYEALLLNIKRNKLEDVIFPFNVAIGSGFNFISSKSSAVNSGICMTSATGDASTHFKVKSMSLDELVFKAGSVDVLKMDVEGAEYEIFSEFKLWDKIKSYHIELHDIPNIDASIKKLLIDKIAKHSSFVKEIPKTPMGRILK